MDINNGTDSNPFDENTPDISAPILEDTNLNPVEDDHSGRNFVWLLLGVAAMVCGLLFAATLFLFRPDTKSLIGRYFPSPTATFTRTPTLTPTITITLSPTLTSMPSLTPTPAPNFQATARSIVNQWPILLSDEFDINQYHWKMGIDNSENSKIIRKITGGKYRWDFRVTKGFVSWASPDTQPVIDFSLTVDAQQVKGSTPVQYGLIFREDNEKNFYYFGIENGEFFVSLSYNDEWINLIQRTKSITILSEKPNRLTVIAEGSHFIFLINGQYVANMTDEHIQKGTTAIAIGLLEANQMGTVEFDNFVLRIP